MLDCYWSAATFVSDLGLSYTTPHQCSTQRSQNWDESHFTPIAIQCSVAVAKEVFICIPIVKEIIPLDISRSYPLKEHRVKITK